MSNSLSRESPCPAPVVCPHNGQRYDSDVRSGSTFPTEAVLGGTLGGLSVIVLGLVLYAACRHWNTTRRRRPTLYHRGPTHRKKTSSAIFGDPLFAYDVSQLPKPWHSCAHMQPDVYIARPYLSTRRQLSQRQALAAMLDSRDDSSEREFCPRNGGGRGAGRGSDDSQYEPSIIAGSFVYHPPTNLPPHLTRTSHTSSHAHPQGQVQRELRPELSYDSFKNDHLYSGSTRGVASSTLNNHHQQPDFYL